MTNHQVYDLEKNPKVLLAHVYTASQDVVNLVLAKPVHDDGRSEFEWIRLANGDLILGVYPRGETYFDIERLVERDYCIATGQVKP